MELGTTSTPNRREIFPLLHVQLRIPIDHVQREMSDICKVEIIKMEILACLMDRMCARSEVTKWEKFK